MRYFPKDHDNPRRRGARIIAFEGDQTFLDKLHTFPKDFPFNIRFGGNIYIRGGDRCVHNSKIYLITNTNYYKLPTQKYSIKKIYLPQTLNTTYPLPIHFQM